MLLYQLSQLVRYVDTLMKQRYRTSHHRYLHGNHYNYSFQNYKYLPSYCGGYQIVQHRYIHVLNLKEFLFDFL